MSGFAALAVLGAAAGILFLLLRAAALQARWKERARAAERENEETRKAHEIQNAVALDPAFRRRVRDVFGKP